MKFASFTVLAVLASGTSAALADATLTYALTDADAGTVGKQIAIARFFARVDSSDRPGEYLLFQAGKFFPLYRVSTEESTYTLLTPPVEPTLRARRKEAPAGDASPRDGQAAPDAPEAPPEAPSSQSASPAEKQASVATGEDTAKETESPAGGTGTTPKEPKSAEAESSGAQTAGAKADAAGKDEDSKTSPSTLPVESIFKTTPMSDTVAGVRCRVVLEVVGGEPAVEHCMANKAALGITERESRTLARLFVMARKQGYGWLGTATADEDFVSVRSKTLDKGAALELVSVSTKPLKQGYLKVPTDFKQVKKAPEGTAAQSGQKEGQDAMSKSGLAAEKGTE
jgi:hypothetical protein